jgi:hypothetical protein
MGANLRRAARHLLVLCGYIFLTVVVIYPGESYLTTPIPIAHQIPGCASVEGDPWHPLWMLWFTKHSLVEFGHLHSSDHSRFPNCLNAIRERGME